MEICNRDEYMFIIGKEIVDLTKELKSSSENPLDSIQINLVLSEKKRLFKEALDDKSNDSYTLMTSTKQKCSESSKKEREMANHFFLKKKHDKNIHKRILLKYSKSAALAPANSEELASAINNRSEFLLHLKKYQYCIDDINYALSITKSVILKSKLLCRKVQCLLSMNKKNDAKNISDEVSKILENVSEEDEENKQRLLKKLQESFQKKYNPYNAHEKKGEDLNLKNLSQLPYISKAVSFKNDSKFGKHLLANRDIKTGEILLVEKPYCMYPDFEQLYIVCSYCLKYTFNSIPCENCIYAVYCSDACQKLAFEEYHDIECSINPFVFAEAATYTTFLSRIFIKLIKDFGIDEIIRQAKDLDKTKGEKKEIFPENSDLISKNYNAIQFFYGLLDQIYQEAIMFIGTVPTLLLNSLKKKKLLY